MKNAENISNENMGVQALLDRYLISRRVLKSSAAETSFHLDDDSLTTFVEGTLSRRESASVVGHLVDCSFCRHKTAELVRLDLEFADVADVTLPGEPAQPQRISAVLNDLFSKIFGTSDDAVFAHEEKESREETDGDEETPGDPRI
jgi:hypothetical protein